MTLITTIKISKSLAITVGEGRVNSSGTITNDDLRKVYYNNNLCIAFAGDTHVSSKLTSNDIFVPNIIEKYVDEFDGDNPLLQVKSLCHYLLSENRKLNLELFITTLTDSIVDVHYVNLQEGCIKTISTDFGILYSTKSGLSTDKISKTFFDVLLEELNIPKEDISHGLTEISEKNIIKFLKQFYKEVYTSLNPLINNTIGKSIDIVVLNSIKGRFDLKENKSISEIAKNQNINK